MHDNPLSSDSAPRENKPADLSKLSKYSISNHLNRYFCSSCGAYVLYETVNPASGAPRWSVSAGSLEKSDGILEAGYHQYIGDTLDGGLADFYQGSEGKIIPRFKDEGHRSETLPIGWQADSLRAKLESSDPPAEESIAAYCQCRRVSFHIKRETTKPKGPEEFWHFAGATDKDPIRFLAGFCACGDCRFASGSIFNPFLFTMRKNIIDDKTGQPIVLGHEEGAKDAAKADAGGRQHYESSPGVSRDFCGTCGASLFYYKAGRFGGELIDIYVGLLDENQDGRRAERWLRWWPAVSHAEAGFNVNQSALKILQDGLKAKIGE